MGALGVPEYLPGAGGGPWRLWARWFSAAAPGVPFFPQHSSWHHAQHGPSFPARRLLLADIDKKGNKDIFYTLELCCPPQLCSAGASSHRGVWSEQHPLSANVNRCECGCDFHQCPSKASDVNSKAKAATLEIPGSSKDSSKFCGCSNRGKECHCMLSLIFHFFPFCSNSLLHFFFSQLLQNSRGTDLCPSGSGPHLGILLFH